MSGATDLTTLPALFDAVAARYPSNQAFISTRRRVTYAELRDVAATIGLDPSDRTWGYLPFFFNAGLVAVALATLARGAAVVAAEVFEPGEALELLEAERCTAFFAWPHQAEALIQHPRFALSKLALHKGVGANVPWAARLYPPDHQAVGTWGMTETGPMFTAWPATAPIELRASGHGAPAAGREVRICDPESGAPVGVETAGEICVRGPTLFSHYDGLPPSDCFDADGYFHTGDLGRLDERGTLHFLGHREQGGARQAGGGLASRAPGGRVHSRDRRRLRRRRRTVDDRVHDRLGHGAGGRTDARVGGTQLPQRHAPRGRRARARRRHRAALRCRRQHPFRRSHSAAAVVTVARGELVDGIIIVARAAARVGCRALSLPGITGVPRDFVLRLTAFDCLLDARAAGYQA
jgi:hypothetical protein